MMHQYDHRWATYDRDGRVRDVTLAEKRDPSFSVLARYWVHTTEVDRVLGDRWHKQWLMGWRDIARATDERTTIAGVVPRVAIGHTSPIAIADGGIMLAAAMNAFVSDYVSRQKVGGTHLTYNILTQLPAVRPSRSRDAVPWDPETTLEAWIARRVVELVYTSNDMSAAAGRMHANGAPYECDPSRRVVLRAELTRQCSICTVYRGTRPNTSWTRSKFGGNPILPRAGSSRRRNESSVSTTR